MARTDDERRIRLRPPKPRVPRNEGAAWSSGFRLLMHYARSSRKAGNRAPGGKGKGTCPYHQRCAVRVTYLNNKTRGQWKAHGRYLARESATFENDAKAGGFNRENDGIDIARQLEGWQRAGDERMFKLIVSPEFGDRVELSRLTRGLIEQMEEDLGTDLEWVAVEHHNTEHPHVHVVVRGVRSDGQPLRLSRDYVKHGIRGIAADLCTRQLGYRTQRDAAEAERREITEERFTSLDRRLLRDAQEISSDLGPHTSPSRGTRFRLVRAKRRAFARSMRLRASPCSAAWAWRNPRDQTVARAPGFRTNSAGNAENQRQAKNARGARSADVRRAPAYGSTRSETDHVRRGSGAGSRPGRAIRAQLPDAGRNGREGVFHPLQPGDGGGPQPRRTTDQLLRTVAEAVRWMGP